MHAIILIPVILVVIVIIARAFKSASGSQHRPSTGRFKSPPRHEPPGPVTTGRPTKATVTCSFCHGSGRSNCGRCGGSGRIACTSCGGSGARFGAPTKANPSGRTQCMSCAGGRMTCSCGGSGRVVCGSCGGSGRRPG
jgi:hypothetical protein